MDKILIILCSFLQLFNTLPNVYLHKSGGISRSIFNFIPFWFRVAKKEVKLCTEKDSLPNPTFLLRDTLYVSTLLKVSFYTQISVQGPSDTTTQLAMAAGGWLPLAVCGCIVSGMCGLHDTATKRV